MKRTRFVWLSMIVTAVFLLAGWQVTQLAAQPPDSQTSAVVTAEQQKQLDQLKQLETQLQKDRTTVHDSIAKYGWDSNQADAAREQLFRDRMDYRQLRRSLRQAGVAVPVPQRVWSGPGSGHRMMRGGPGKGRMGGGMWRGRYQCPCGRW
jgi:uncharacterized protein YlxW (UPF0749 family)